MYYPKGTSTIYLERSNPDNNYVYQKMVGASSDKETEEKLFASFKANFAIGIQSAYYLTKEFLFSGGLVYNMVLNDLYKTNGDGDYTKISLENGINTIINNFRIEFGFSYHL
ncbi:MAG: hypothetical protein LKE39_01930 [Sphaerochaeta sp.]|jgi:hypothetical protein|nr:hypothetical protein [Sphaerochaeta sp.]